MTALRFTLSDTGGGSHDYEYTLHRPRDGWKLTTRLSSCLIRPILAGLGPAVVAAVETAPKGKGLIAGLIDSPEALAGLDFGKAAEGIEAAVRAVDEETLFAVLRYTNRDGRALVGDNGKPTEVFDEAYAGNYYELLRAFWSVASGNGFLPALDSFTAVGKSIGSVVATTLG